MSRKPRVPLSPLRYPGGKTRFVPHLVEWLAHHGHQHFDHVVEPFAGGASVSLGLLKAGVVNHAHVSDADLLVGSFWVEAVNNAQALCDKMDAEPVTVERWKHWKSVDEDFLDRCDKAFKALFLNRTTFSGLIRHGSVLGGIDQDQRIAAGEKVAYPIDCRFNKEALRLSIERISCWGGQGRIEAACADYQDAVIPDSGSTLLYLDPPYVEKSEQLYGPEFGEQEHRKLANFVSEYDVPFVLSYDDMPMIRDLYSTIPGVHFTTPSWSYGMGASKKSRELLISNVRQGAVKS